MLKFHAINKWFGAHHIIRDLDASVDDGDFIVILGTNGAGKSTLFDLIAGRLKPTSGTIMLDGVDVTNRDEQHRALMVTRIFQAVRLNCVGSLTVAQNLAIARYSRRNVRLVDGQRAMSIDEAEKLLSDLGMDAALVHKQMDSLSGGQRQLISFAMATQLIPKILLLDEPTAALDPKAATTLLCYAAEFIKQHKITTLMITHDPHIALNLGNKIWILEEGKIARQFTADEKKNLNPDQLIGQIDYDRIKEIG